MTKTKNVIWSLVLKAVERMQERSNRIILYTDAKAVFEENFEYYYNYFIKNFMYENKEDNSLNIKNNSLDRHKLGSIIICSIIDAKIVGVSKDFLENCGEDDFLGNEKIAFEVALSYMYAELEKDFKEGKVPYQQLFEQYTLPIPYSCNRKYGEVICRDLHFSNQHYKLSPLLLANILFLIEDYSFQSSNIQRISHSNVD